jgi:hypothetical protein
MYQNAFRFLVLSVPVDSPTTSSHQEIPLQFIIVEDTGYKNLLPFTATRPVFDLLCGTCYLPSTFNISFHHKMYVTPCGLISIGGLSG